MKRKFLLTSPFLALSLFISQMAHAVDTTLTLSGQITPVACTIAIANGGAFQFGDIVASSLNKTSETVMPAQTSTLSIQCNAPTMLGLGATDNRLGTEAVGSVGGASDSTKFGVGRDSDGEAIGAYHMLMVNMTNNGTPIESMRTLTSGATWEQSTPNGVIYDGAPTILTGFSLPGTGNAVAPIESFQATMNVPLFIAPSDRLLLTQAINIDGSSTIELVYF
ncbi:hypothetical protein D3C75_644330 [compost metagenome]